MECDFLCPRMRAQLFDFRGVFFPHCPIPTYSLQFLEKTYTRPRKFLPSMTLNSWSCATVNDIESSPSSNVAVNQYLEESHSRPKSVSLPNWSNSSSNVQKASKRRSGLGRIRTVNYERNERLRWYSEMLRDCSLNKSLNEGKSIHGQVIKSGINPDLHLQVSLVDLYAKCGSCESARLVFDKMPEHDVVSWTALISGFVAEGHGSDSVQLFSEMRMEGTRPNEFSFSVGLKACSLCLELEFGKQMHADVIKAGLFSDLFVGSGLVDLYAKCGETELASRVFFCMPQRNAVAWNALLNGYAQNGDAEEVFNLFCRMTESEIKFSKVTLSTVLKGCTNSESLRAGRVVHSLAIRIGCECDELLSCCLVDMYSKFGLAEDSLKVFRKIKDPDIVTWSAMITCLDQQGRSEEAAGLFNLMRRTGVRPNQYTFASLINVATDLGNLCYGESIHACSYKCGVESYTLVSNTLISMYMKIGSVQHGYHVFKEMKDLDLVSWNALLTGFHEDETCDWGPSIFSQLLLEGFRPNMYTYISILRSCCSLLNLSFGKQVHSHIIKNNLENNTYVGTALIDMYAKGRYLEDADLIFNRLNERDVFTWTVIISGYAQIDQGELAIRRFSQMQREGVNPNEFTLASCLSSCSSIGTIGNGQQLHSLAIKDGWLDDVFVGSALVDMYAKCGCIEDAEAVFEALASRDVVSWNTILCGYSQHGKGAMVLEAFRMMLDEGIMPDEITFIGVLSACSRMGLIEEGRKHFDSMNKIYGISPTIEHYACMVDILGRAGKLDEVERFVMERELPSNASIWKSVLGACKMHGNVELGEKVARKLFELEPEVDSNYVLLSNIFASQGMWDDVKEVRALMTNRGIKKEPGCSWVEVDAQVHVFLSQDCSHPMTREIYIKLEELGKKLTSAGYIPKTEYVLHNVSEEGKRENLFYHSERLALAYALISTNSRKPIRIFKNLRICGDCHCVMKLISGMTNLEIVIRDVSQFHHFKDGICSCQDYW